MVSIAIDGPSGAGKSSLAKALAKDMGYVYVDTGAMYRSIGLYAVRAGVDPHDAAAVTALLPEIQLDIRLEDGTQQLRLCREHAQLTAKAWGLSDEETYSLWLEEWNRLYAQCVDGAAEDQRAAVAEARDWALLLIKSQRVVWRAKYDRQDAEVEARMARLIVDKCVELCRQMGSQQ